MDRRSLRDEATTIAIVSAAHGLSHFCQLLVPPLFPWIGAEGGLTNTQLGLLMSVFFVTSCGAQAAAGFIVDRFGAYGVLLGGVALLAAGALGLAASPGYAAMLPCMALAGLGNAVFHPVDFSILNARVGSSRLGQAYAAHGISGNAGWALAPICVVGITVASGSWRVALAAVGAALVVALALLWRARRHLEVPASHSHAAAGASTQGLGFLKLPALWACFGFFLVFALALGGVQSFAPAAAGRMHAVSVEAVAAFLSTYMLAAAAGMVLGGQLLRDPTRSVRVAAFGFALAAGMALLIAIGRWSPAALFGLFAAMGLFAGIAGPSRDLLVKQATPPGATGRVYGVVYSGLDVGMALAPLAFGLLMDAGEYRAVWLGVAALFALLVASAVNVRLRAVGTQTARA